MRPLSLCLCTRVRLQHNRIVSFSSAWYLFLFHLFSSRLFSFLLSLFSWFSSPLVVVICVETMTNTKWSYSLNPLNIWDTLRWQHVAHACILYQFLFYALMCVPFISKSLISFAHLPERYQIDRNVHCTRLNHSALKTRRYSVRVARVCSSLYLCEETEAPLCGEMINICRSHFIHECDDWRLLSLSTNCCMFTVQHSAPYSPLPRGGEELRRNQSTN